jgi:hypothetical protein
MKRHEKTWCVKSSWKVLTYPDLTCVAPRIPAFAILSSFSKPATSNKDLPAQFKNQNNLRRKDHETTHNCTNDRASKSKSHTHTLHESFPSRCRLYKNRSQDKARPIEMIWNDYIDIYWLKKNKRISLALESCTSPQDEWPPEAEKKNFQKKVVTRVVTRSGPTRNFNIL